MPVLQNQHWELFAQHIASGRSAGEALKLAGYADNPRNADRMKKREEGRIEELLEERAAQNAQATAKAVEELALTQEWVLGELKQNAEKAAETGQYGPANRALELIGKQLGMFIERQEITQNSEFRGLTLEEMRKELVVRARRLGLDRELAGLLEGPKAVDEDQGDNQMPRYGNLT
jgi:hypothetical protein